MKRGFIILIAGCFLVLVGFSVVIVYVSEWFGKMDAPIMRPIEGFDYVVIAILPYSFSIGIIGIVVQSVGGIILFLDRKKHETRDNIG
ncbi:MAG: hypothetical protein ACRD94_03395 [Nitrosopumilaceae archaeon]